MQAMMCNPSSVVTTSLLVPLRPVQPARQPSCLVSAPSSFYSSHRALATLQICKAAPTTAIVDRTMMVKISLARTSGSLDLSWMELKVVPEDIFELQDLEELSLAGNNLDSLPEGLSKFSSLARLQLAGNRLTSLPAELMQLTNLEELWVHGNLLEHLPEDIGALVRLRKLSLSGNRLTSLPESLSSLTDMREITASGNLIQEAPACLGALGKLTNLCLNGNRLTSVAPEIGQCTSLRTLSLQANQLPSVPSEITNLQALEELCLSDNKLESLQENWAGLDSLKLLWIYGNQLRSLPTSIITLPQLESVWAEGNPLERASLQPVFDAVKGNEGRLRELGLDTSQVEGMEASMDGAIASKVRIGETFGHGPGYFKLRRGGDIHHAPEHADGDADLLEKSTGAKVLVVTFASAPGTPNWGGVLNRIASEAQPAEKAFDVLYVCDGGRAWYSAGDVGLEMWQSRLEAVTERYSRVMMLGDSMGATAALLFSHLATSVHVFTPQVDLAEASMRPGQSQAWLSKVKERVLTSVKASKATIVCHTGNWQHDLDQAKLLPAEDVEIKVYPEDTHRLALALNHQKKLLPTVKNAILQELGLYKAPRLSNIL